MGYCTCAVALLCGKARLRCVLLPLQYMVVGISSSGEGFLLSLVWFSVTKLYNASFQGSVLLFTFNYDFSLTLSLVVCGDGTGGSDYDMLLIYFNDL